MLFESVGKQDPCAEIDIAAPEGAEFFAAEAFEFEPLCSGLLLRDDHRVLRCSFDGRDDLVESESDRSLRFWIEVDLLRLVVGVSGLGVPVLAFALVGREPYGFAGCEMELLIHVEDGLHIVVASIKVGESAARVAEGLRVDDERGARREVLRIYTEAFCRVVGFPELHAGLGLSDLAKTRMRWPVRGFVEGTVTSIRCAEQADVAARNSARAEVLSIHSLDRSECGESIVQAPERDKKARRGRKAY